jgi:hypothetical protein
LRLTGQYLDFLKCKQKNIGIPGRKVDNQNYGAELETKHLVLIIEMNLKQTHLVRVINFMKML